MPRLNNKPLDAEKIWVLVTLFACVLGLNLFLFAEARSFLDRSQQTTEENARQWTKNMALALEREIAGQVGKIDLALLSVTDEIERQQNQARIDEAALNEFLQRLHQRLPQADAIRITDANGLLRYGTDRSPDRIINLSDREHFRTLKTKPDAGLVMSKPQISRTNGKWVVVFARSVNDVDGKFHGMVFIPIQLTSLTDTFSRIGIPKQGSITLRSTALEIIARYPAPQDGGKHVGQSKVGQAFVELLKSGAKEGSFYALTPLDGISRLLYFRKVGDYPLLLIVGRAKAEYLEEWSKHRSLAMFTSTSFLLATLLISGLMYGYWRRVIAVRDEMANMAKNDYLTGLVNRRAFIAATENEIARSLRYHTAMSLLMLDIDHFKAINDMHGHEVGDQALQHLAACARSVLREVDLIGRWGGEEFVVLLPETNALRAEEAAERLRQEIEHATLTVGDQCVKFTVSIGCTTLAGSDKNINDLLKRADDALFCAKNSGRNSVAQRLLLTQ